MFSIPIERDKSFQNMHMKNFLFQLARFYTSPKVRYRPQNRLKDENSATGAGGAGVSGNNNNNLEHLSVVFNLIVSIIDQVIASLPNMAPAASGN